MRWPRALVVVLSVGGCAADLEIASNSKVRCASTADCPAGWRCSDTLERCIAPGADEVPPEIVDGTFTATPMAVRDGATLSVFFTVSEPLGTPPRVTLVWSVSERASASLAAQADLTYTFNYDATSNETERLVSIVVELTDPDGNESTSEFPDAVRFDFTSPVLDGAPAVRLGSRPDLLVVPTDVGLDTTVRAAFTLSEQLVDATSVVRAVDSTAVPAFALSQVTVQGTTYEYAGTLATPPPSQGEYVIELLAFDAAGNQSVLELGRIQIDTVDPPVPDVSTANRILHTRVPWGDSAGPPRFSVRAAPTSLEPGAVLVVLESNDLAGLELGRGTATAMGEVASFSLLPFDIPRPWVTAVDAAGNTSAPVAIAYGSWTASTRGIDSPMQPHRLFSQARSRPYRDDPTARPVPSTRALDTIDGTADFVQLEGQLWQVHEQVPPAFEIPGAVLYRVAPLGASSGYDPLRGRVMAYGGETGFGTSDDVWTLDEVGWHRLDVGTFFPPGRRGARFVYDQARDVWVLHGGSTLDDTWELSGAVWTEEHPGGPGAPPPRSGASMAYDPLRERMVLFGGCTGTCDTNRNDTWEWDGVAWTDVTPPGTKPPARHAASFTFSPTDGELLLFGGCAMDVPLSAKGECASQLGDTWIFDGTRWLDLAPTGAPAARHAAVVTHDPDGTVYLYGGATSETMSAAICAEGPPAGWRDLWTWTASTGWNRVTPDTGDCRALSPLVFDVAASEPLLVGGITNANSPTEVLFGVAARQVIAWNGSGWLIREGAHRGTLSARAAHSMAFDPDLGAAVMFGGQGLPPQICDDEADEFCVDTWAYASGGWDKLEDTGPASRSSGGMVYLDAVDDVVYFGGKVDSGSCDGLADPDFDEHCDTLWEYDAGSWTRICGAGTACSGPGARRLFAMAASNTQILLFGGAVSLNVSCPANTSLVNSECMFNDTWRYLGGTWTKLCGDGTACSQHPSARIETAMVYDESRDVFVLFGGNTWGDCGGGQRDCADTWEHGIFGTPTCPAAGVPCWRLACDPGAGCPSPPLRSRHAMVYDAGRGRVVLLGGSANSGSTSYEDAWEWDGAMWHEPGLLTPAPDRSLQSAVYDSQRQRIVAFGGIGEFTNGDVLELDRDPLIRPAIIMHAAWSNSGIGATSAIGVTFTAYSGGAGSEIMTPSPLTWQPAAGVTLAAWDNRRFEWASIGNANHATANPGAVTGSSANAAEASDWLRAADGTLQLRVQPRSGTGPGGGDVSLDYAEVVVEYGP